MTGHFQVFYDEVDYHISNEGEVLLWLLNVVKTEGKTIGEVNIVFVSDERLLEINKDFLDHDYYTDVITFDGSKGSTISGEIYISVDRIKENAMNTQDVDNERDRVCVHGVLHLLGYADKSEEDKRGMTEREDYYLNLRPYVSRET